MIRGLYTAYTGMVNEQKRLDIISNNVANAATAGYKKEGVTSKAFDNELTLKIKDNSVAVDKQKIGNMSLGVNIGEVYTDFGQGSFRQTNNTYDLAIEGKGFFQVSVTDAEGNNSVKYTRDGSFTMTYDGFIVDTNGNHLLGTNGELRVPTNASSIIINYNGQIFADEQLAGQIQLADFEDYSFIEKFGDNMYQTVDGAVAADATGTVRQGYLEQSNVNVVDQMVNLIAITRAYETNQKMIHTVDSMTEKAVNEVGKV